MVRELILVLEANPVFYLLAATAFGLIVGSFLNVVIHRLPVMLERDWRLEIEAHERQGSAEQTLEGDLAAPREPRYNLATPASSCPVCGHKIRAIENIPVISWLMLRGRCPNCGTKISIRYPIVELLTGLATLAVAWRFGPGWEALAAAILTWYLIPLAAIDIDHQLLPDILTLPLLWIGLTLSLFSVPETEVLFIASSDAIVGALAGYLSLWIIYQAFLLLTGKEGMGYGDFKLFAALGAWLGWQTMPLLILIAAGAGTLFALAQMVARRSFKTKEMPFGQWLAAAGWLVMLGGQQLQDAYLNLLGA